MLKADIQNGPHIERTRWSLSRGRKAVLLSAANPLRHMVSRILPSKAASFVINDGEDCHYLRQPTLSLFFPLPIASQEDFHEVTAPPTPRNQRGLSERSSRRLRRPRARPHRPGRRKRRWQIDLDRLDLCRPLPPAAGAEAVTL